MLSYKTLNKHGKLYVVPMAGLGSRFSRISWKFKPLIEVNKRTLLEYSLKSLPITREDFVLLIVLDNAHNDEISYELKRLILPCEFEIIKLAKLTRGQAQTVYFGLLKLNRFLEKPLLIHNCDTAFNFPEVIEKPKPDGEIFLFESNDKRYSYAELDSDNTVRRTAEKVVISKYATSGTYIFNSAERFIEAYEGTYVSNRNELGEEFIAPIYNYLIKKGGRVVGTMVDHVFTFGTPEEVEENRMRALELWRPAW